MKTLPLFVQPETVPCAYPLAFFAWPDTEVSMSPAHPTTPPTPVPSTSSSSLMLLPESFTVTLALFVQFVMSPFTMPAMPPTFKMG